MSGGLDAPQNPVTAAGGTYHRPPIPPGFPGSTERVPRPMAKSAPKAQSIPAPFTAPTFPRYNPASLSTPGYAPASSQTSPPFRGTDAWPPPSYQNAASEVTQPLSEITTQPSRRARVFRVTPNTNNLPQNPPAPPPQVQNESIGGHRIVDPIIPLDRSLTTIPVGDVPDTINTRGPPSEPLLQGPPVPAVNWSIPGPQGPGWDFTPLQLILESPVVARNIPACPIPSPLNYLSREQVEFYLIKQYGDELYKSWLQANGDWHGVPEQPDTEDADARPATTGIKESLRDEGLEEPELETSIWAPKMVGTDVYFLTDDEKLDNQLQHWEVGDTDQLRPHLGPTNVCFTLRLKNLHLLI